MYIRHIGGKPLSGEESSRHPEDDGVTTPADALQQVSDSNQPRNSTSNSEPPKGDQSLPTQALMELNSECILPQWDTVPPQGIEDQGQDSVYPQGILQQTDSVQTIQHIGQTSNGSGVQEQPDGEHPQTLLKSTNKTKEKSTSKGKEKSISKGNEKSASKRKEKSGGPETDFYGENLVFQVCMCVFCDIIHKLMKVVCYSLTEIIWLSVSVDAITVHIHTYIYMLTS